MILLDSDHVSVLLDERNDLRASLSARLTEAEDLRLPIIVVEEQMRGWLALIRRTLDVHEQINPYRKLAKTLDFLCEWPVAAWDADAADAFKKLRPARVRIGTQDLKIASISLVHDATLLSANLVDFEQVPDLRVEDWLHR